MIGSALSAAYPWPKSFRVISVIAWLAALLSLTEMRMARLQGAEVPNGERQAA